mmetsp:Transcript_51556/g.71564  ORF Transcript_51556/g.71564 Transcript_51556/m.71564 type:complete len:261 (+) Transcript_51556:1308-2090(+)
MDLRRMAIFIEAHTLQTEVLWEEQHCQVVDDWQHEEGGEDHLDLQHALDVDLCLHWGNVCCNKSAKDANHNASGRDGHREEHSIPAGCRQSVVGALNCCCSDDQRSAGALSEGTKQVSTHASNVTHVVTHVVSDGSRIVGIILVQSSNDLAAKISAHIGCLRVDATAHAAEHCHGAASETIPSSAVEKDLPVISFWIDLAVDRQQNPQDKHTQGAQGIAHDAASAKSGVEAIGVALLCTCKGGSCIGEGGNHHSQEATQH